jgi:formamidopyrimidine-DNA glycosylase
MPEGPEVETIKRGLELGIVGQTVSSVEVTSPKSFQASSETISKDVQAAEVEHVGRRAKVLLIRLNNGYTLMTHLKMTGQMVLVKRDGDRFAGGHPTPSMAGSLPDSTTRVIFEFASGDKLYFNDLRRFGWIKLVPSSEVDQDSLVARLGPEPSADKFTMAYLAAVMIRHKGAPVKAVLLDQAAVAGLGNIYVDESLHLARIHPARRGGSLTAAEVKRLHRAVKEIMALAIDHGGTSFSRFVNALGGKGDYLEHARVFRREGQPCPVHPGTLVQKTRVAGRGTHICPRCQRL